MIAHQRDTYNWVFTFVGANQDAIATASAVGISGASAMSYTANAGGTRAVFGAMASNMRKMRQGAPGNVARAMSYSPKQRQDALDGEDDPSVPVGSGGGSGSSGSN
jgi:hypothetical protein